MYNLKQFRVKKVYGSSFSPWGKIIPPGIVINKDGSLMSIIQYRGPDLDSETAEKLAIVTAQLNDLFMKLDSGYILYFEADRKLSTTYDKDVHFTDEVSKNIDEERKKLFSSAKNNFETTFYFTICYYPPTDMEEKLKNIMVENNSTKKEKSLDEYLQNFIKKSDSILNSLNFIGLPYINFLNSNEIATYLHSIVSNKDHKVVLHDKLNQYITNDDDLDLVDAPMLVDNFLFDTPLIAGFHPKLGDYYLKVVVPLNFPPISVFGLFNGLNFLGFEYRWITRFFCLNKQDSLEALELYNKGWKGKVVPLMKQVKEMIMGHSDIDGSINENAMRKVEEVKDAKNAVEADDLLYGYYSMMVIVKSKNEEEADKQAATVVQFFTNMGITAKIEDINAVDSYFSSLPGNIYNNVRKPLISTENLVHMMPITNIWAGDYRNKCLNGPPLIYTKTIGNTPFRLNLHVGDVGHTMVIGPTGAGKSVHLCLIEAQFKKYKDAQVFIFDKGASSKVLTLGVGGDFYDLGSEEKTTNKVSFQPLLRIDSEKERTWILEWLCDYLVQEKVEVNPEIKKYIWTALTDMCTFKESEQKKLRTMSTFINTIQSKRLREAFRPLTSDGAYGSVFDASKENLSFSSWQAFEMQALMDNKSIVGPTLMYLFHRIEEALDGRPTIIVLDECWTFLNNEAFAKKIKEWLKVLRKYNASVIFATQSLEDIRNSSIFDTVLNSCVSRIFLPNDKALNEQNKELYKTFGLNERQIEIIATATPKRQYYYDSSKGSRLYELALGKYTLSYIAVSKKDLIKAEEILTDYDRDEFNLHWQQYKGLRKE